MAVVRVSTTEYETFTGLPENADRVFEFIGGEIIEVGSNPYSSEIASLISFFIRLFIRENGIVGRVTGEAGLYDVMGDRYAPDVAFIASADPLPYEQGYNPDPPQLAVEVISPSDRSSRLAVKVANYLAAGTVVWVVYPQEREVHVYAPGQRTRILGEGDVIDGGDVLPGFSLPVREIFA
jgi:Uma2 family endonuclease